MDEFCPQCGSTLKKRRESVTPLILDNLVKMREAVFRKGENNIMPSKELDLTKSQYNNFQKLRYHALIAKVINNNIWEEGHWLITHRGAEFLNGRMRIPKSVWIYKNKIVAKSEDMIGVEDVLNTVPYLERKGDIVYQDVLPTEVETVVKKITQKHKKGKQYCTKCNSQMKVLVTMVPSVMNENTVKAVRSWKCINPDCGQEIKID